MISLSASQQLALEQLRHLVEAPALRPTYILTGAPGVGKSIVAARLGGRVCNFTLEWLEEFFATRNPLYLNTAALIEFILVKIQACPDTLVVLDGLEAALTGLVPERRQEIPGVLQALVRQSTGKRLVIVIASAAGSLFLTPSFADQWEDPTKVVTLPFKPQDAIEVASAFGLDGADVEGAESFYDLMRVKHTVEGVSPSA